MMNTQARHILSLFFLAMFTFGVQAQEMLDRQEAVKMTLENNFGILMADNRLRISENNAGILNSGYLPTLRALGGANYSRENEEATLQNGNTTSVSGAETNRYNASVNLNYLLFDGLGRYYNYQSLKEQYNLSELEVRETIEITLLQMFSVYYEVARLTENVTVLKEILENTKDRLRRAELQFEYGQNTRLGILNAEVDIATDSINLLRTKQQLANAKRDLNVVLNTELNQKWEVDTTITFVTLLDVENYIAEAEANNVRLLQAEKNIAISGLNRKISKAVFLPALSLTGSYGWNQGNFPSTSFQTSRTNYGFNGGLSLSWDLFNGRNIIDVKNARIQYENQELLREELKLWVKRDIANALANYRTRREIYELQRQNLENTRSNFERSEERFRLGQITSLELRQAQVNLLNALTTLNTAKYEAKLAELELLQLTGRLLSQDF